MEIWENTRGYNFFMFSQKCRPLWRCDNLTTVVERALSLTLTTNPQLNHTAPEKATLNGSGNSCDCIEAKHFKAQSQRWVRPMTSKKQLKKKLKLLICLYVQTLLFNIILSPVMCFLEPKNSSKHSSMANMLLWKWPLWPFHTSLLNQLGSSMKHSQPMTACVIES